LFRFHLLRPKAKRFPDVPRDSSQQYVWVRKAGDFERSREPQGGFI
jgi:hypothetical protein